MSGKGTEERLGESNQQVLAEERSKMTPGTRTMSRETYIIPPPGGQRQCIASTPKGMPCRGNISNEDLADASSLQSQVESTRTTEERRHILRQVICLRVCNNRHRHKLKSNEKCLDRLVHIYDESLPEASEIQSHTEIRQQIQSQPDIDGSAKTYDRDEHGLPTTVHSAEELARQLDEIHLEQQIFRPYGGSSRKDIKKFLRSKVPERQAKTGFLYVFEWPSNPGFIKVGYAKTAVENRLKFWRKCHPGATLVASTGTISNPERVEGLIHLEMASKRYEITECAVCRKTHIEWFKASAEDATKMIHDWQKIMQRGQLYDDNGTLSTDWGSRITGLLTITAETLLKVLGDRSEYENPSSVRRKDCTRVSVKMDSLLPSDTPSTSAVVKPSVRYEEQAI